MKRNWQVEKYGGTSLADAQRFGAVADRLCEKTQARVVVVSAPAGVTDALHRCWESGSLADFQCVLDAQIECAKASLAGTQLEAERAALGADGERLARQLADALGDGVGGNAQDFVSSGEIWSARLLAGMLRQRKARAVSLDAADFLSIASGEMGPMMRRRESLALLQGIDSVNDADILVVTGYRARDANAGVTNLGRNGSDLSASFLAALLGADRLTIWTDVDGVLDADPALVADAHVVPELSYSEALELAHFGARVVHPHTIGPALEANIPIHIRNTFRPRQAGTVIHGVSGAQDGVRGVSVQSKLALINLEGAGLMGVPGTAQRLFAAIQGASVSVVLISQGGSEHSICFLVPEDDAQRALAAVNQEFGPDQRYGYVEQVNLVPECSILAVVGAGMTGTPGIAGRFFSALGRAGVNVRGIAQGSSEQNISAVVNSADAARGLRAVHAAFYLSPQTLSLGIVGAGNIGRELLRQLHQEAARLRRRAGVDFRIRAVARSNRMLLADRELGAQTLAANWSTAAESTDMERFIAHVQADHIPHCVVVDATADPNMADHYCDWLARGIHVITPNKHAGSGSLQRYRRIMDARGAADFHYETTVGAGLPILQTLRDLRETGDRILHIEGMLSGTLSYLFNCFEGGVAFSEILAQAREQGFTEPDPRDDLSGMDVARKLVILGREAGLDIGLEDVEVESLVPRPLRDIPLEDFLQRSAEMDAPMAAQLEAARSCENELRFTAALDVSAKPVRGRVGIAQIAADHPFAHINLTDNIVRFTTERYRDTPLIIQGPGAGPAVTAGGVFAELLRLATAVGARL